MAVRSVCGASCASSAEPSAACRANRLLTHNQRVGGSIPSRRTTISPSQSRITWISVVHLSTLDGLEFHRISLPALRGSDDRAIQSPGSGQSIVLAVHICRHGERGRGMAEPLRNHGRGYAAKVHEGFARMPCIVEPNHRQSARFGHPPELIGEPLRPVGVAQFIHHQMLTTTVTTASCVGVPRR